MQTHASHDSSSHNERTASAREEGSQMLDSKPWSRIVVRSRLRAHGARARRMRDRSRAEETAIDERLLALVGCIGGIVLEFDADARYLDAWADEPELLARPASGLRGRTIDEVLGPGIGAPL